ncbi:hypothetical protein [Kribbella sp. NPDC051718]|uniref:hypothetical protein n=1 Tax=Kribbella sp. NPDC051718 TaxID=3155168 RepID=UPI0034466357
MTSEQNDSGKTPAGDDRTDPIGRITMPERSRIGFRALVLVGAASVLSTGLATFTECVPVTTTVSN